MTEPQQQYIITEDELTIVSRSARAYEVISTLKKVRARKMVDKIRSTEEQP